MPKNNKTDLLKTARFYRSKGYNPLPCLNFVKGPFGADDKGRSVPERKWKDGDQVVRLTDEEFEDWFTRKNLTGVGVVGGETSGLTNVDFDDYGKGFKSIPLSSAVEIKTTSNGGRFVFKYSKGDEDLGNLKNIEVKVNTFSVFPPSKCYTKQDPSKIGNYTFEKEDWDKLGRLPEEFRQWFLNKKQIGTVVETENGSTRVFTEEEMDKICRDFGWDICYGMKESETITWRNKPYDGRDDLFKDLVLPLHGKFNEIEAEQLIRFLDSRLGDSFNNQAMKKWIVDKRNYALRANNFNNGQNGVKTAKNGDLSQLQAQNYIEPGVYAGNLFGEIKQSELEEILNLTIKADKTNKVITFLCYLNAFTDHDQFNLGFIAPSSSGKSYISIETLTLFPREDVIKLGYVSPTAFYHSNGKFDKERKAYVVNLERKILVFLDMPHTMLLEKLRPLLSHDDREIIAKITDRNKRGQNRSKDVIIRGFPSVVFASASFKMDEQELTRFLLLSPETNTAKVAQALSEVMKKATNEKKYYEELNSNPLRQEIMARIVAIRDARVSDVLLHDPDKLQEMFDKRHPFVKARHTRDLKRVIALAKGWALLNLWGRGYKDGVITTKDIDYKTAFKLWDVISLPQELGLSPYLFNVYKEIFCTAYKEKGAGLDKKDIQKKFFEVHHKQLPNWQLTQEIIPNMETSGVILQEKDPDDGRKMLVTPVYEIKPPTKKGKDKKTQEGVRSENKKKTTTPKKKKSHLHTPPTQYSFEAKDTKKQPKDTKKLPVEAILGLDDKKKEGFPEETNIQKKIWTQ